MECRDKNSPVADLLLHVKGLSLPKEPPLRKVRMPIFKLKSRKGWTLCENCFDPILKGEERRFCERCLKEKKRARNHGNYLKQVALGWRHY
jgi:predicted amidophosphoribosyltransferase